MKRFLIALACVMLASSAASAEALPGTSPTPAPQIETTAEPQGVSYAADGTVSLDFDLLTPDNPVATPVAVDPIDKPTPTPTPAPDFVYETYINPDLGLSFSVPYTWLLNPNTDQSTTVQFVEPKSEMMEKDGYQTRMTYEKISRGLEQSASDAREYLESYIDEFGASFTNFSAGKVEAADFGAAKGYYCYYKADYNDGSKTYEMNGRITVVAHRKALYQIRLTAPRDWFSYYNHLWRKSRSTIVYMN